MLALRCNLRSSPFSLLIRHWYSEVINVPCRLVRLLCLVKHLLYCNYTFKFGHFHLVIDITRQADHQFIILKDRDMWSIYALAVLIICICVRAGRSLRSPLSKIPGPEHTKFTAAWLILQEFSSNRRLYIHGLHQQYGPVVRLGPNEISFTSLEAVKEIYTSGGSSYNKTELYNLFMQFGFR